MSKFTGFIFLLFCILVHFVLNSKSNSETAKSFSAHPFSLKEISSEVGIQHTHTTDEVHASIKNVNPWISSVGASIAVADINNDGFQDIYFCQRHRQKPNLLYINTGDGHFTEKAEEFKIAHVNSPYPCMRPLFFDYNNDGRKDLFLGTTAFPKIFEQTVSGKFEEVTQKSGIGKISVYAHAANVLDYDKDGDLDLIISAFLPAVDYYNPNTTEFMPNHPTSAKNGGPTILYKNNGDGTFSDVTEASGISLPGWVFAISVYDFNYDGWPDFWVANDFNSNSLYINNKDGTFTDASSRLGTQWAFSGMGADIQDIDHDKKPFVFVSHSNDPGNHVAGNQLWKFAEPEHISDVAKTKGVLACGWAWGSKFIDIDNNGFEDLVVANGFLSQNPNKDYWYYMNDIFASGSQFMTNAKNWHDMTDYTMSGFQKSCLFYNDNGVFKDIADSTPLKNYTLDGRAVSTIDYLNNGSLSFIITNQNDKPLFFANQQMNKNNWIGFRLISKEGHPDVYGALIEIHLDDKVLTKQSFYNNGLIAQSDSRVHFGLGPISEVKKVTIQWPSGTSQELKNLSVNKYHEVQEGKKP